MTSEDHPHDASAAGLTESEASARLARNGPNALPEPARRSRLVVVRDVLREPMLLLLLAASSVYLVLGDAQQAALLSASVALVIWLNVRQEQRAETALQALRDLARPQARVLRDGVARTIAARDLVVGDVILIAEGERVPADALVIEESDLHVDESLLTGESMSVHRGVSSRLDGDDRLHASTLVVRGHATAEVSATGADTAVGRIGASMHAIEPERSPLQLEMRRVVLLFAGLAAVACVTVTGLSFVTRGDLLAAALAGLTLAIATIPEEFPMVVSVFQAIGSWRLAQRKALVRHPSAIETLGAISVLCVDKTGTLTENRMAVAETRGDETEWTHRSTLTTLLDVAMHASRSGSQDPMDRALFDAGRTQVQVDAPPLKLAREYPLSPRCPAMAQVWTDEAGQWTAACKGAPETIADLCRLPDADRARVLAEAEAMGRRGLRVLGVAESRSPTSGALPSAIAEFDLAWRGLVGFADPLRAGIDAAVRDAHGAGIRVLMLTGDHVETARAIAHQAGIDTASDILTGAQIDGLDDATLADRLAHVSVCARVRPEHKLRLVESLRSHGAVVAMTGDGVNDAPALLASHVGIAMGGRGTDVAREAASIVLLDDNFVTIVGAIALGRRIYRNIRRAVAYILAVHVPIAGLALLPLVTGGPLVLLPLHVVFLELIIDPACSIVFEQEADEAAAMQRPPRSAGEKLLTIRSMAASLLAGAAMFAAVLAVYLSARVMRLPDGEAGALTFSTLVIGNLALVVVFRGGDTLWDTLRRHSVAFSTMAVAALALLLSVTFLPLPARWFGFAPPPLALWLLSAVLPLPIAAAAKWGRHFHMDGQATTGAAHRKPSS